MVVDISDKCETNTAATLEAEDLENWVKENGTLPDQEYFKHIKQNSFDDAVNYFLNRPSNLHWLSET